MKYTSQRHTFIFRSNVWSYWPIISKDDVHTSKSLQDIIQNQWSMKYRLQWPTSILRSNVGSYWFIILNKDVHTSNSLQDIRQNHRTMKYRSVTYINFEVKRRVLLIHTPKVWCTYIKQSSRCKAKSLDREIQVMLTFTSLPTSPCHKVEPCLICINCFHNRKAENTF